MEPYWVALIKAAVTKTESIKRYWKLVTGFVARVWTLSEAKEAKQIENMARYLETVAKQLTALKHAGVPGEELRKLAVSLNVPLIQANLEAMIIARQFSSVPKQHTSSGKKAETESQQTSTDNSESDPTPPQR